jgi:hypothetical protein
VSSRKEQKEALRRQREEREQAAKAALRRRQMMGYGVGGALALVAGVIVVVLLVSGGGDGGGPNGGGDLYPSGVEIPDPGPLSADLERAAKAAGCTLESKRAASRDHLEDQNATEKYDQNPPTSGRHFAIPADDGIYDEAPDKEDLVHSLEHGRVIIWFKANLPGDDRGMLKTLLDEDPFHMILTPNETNMPYAVAATAWNEDPQPLGTGQLMGCPRFNDEVIDALRAFKDEHRDRGPEIVN